MSDQLFYVHRIIVAHSFFQNFSSSFLLISLLPLTLADKYPKYEYHDHEHYDHHPAYYKYAYGVKDDYHGTHFGHTEKRDGHYTSGEYHVLLPDGRTQTVSYHVDGKKGYVAKVTYSGHKHEVHHHKPHYKPHYKSHHKPKPQYVHIEHEPHHEPEYHEPELVHHEDEPVYHEPEPVYHESQKSVYHEPHYKPERHHIVEHEPHHIVDVEHEPHPIVEHKPHHIVEHKPHHDEPHPDEYYSPHH